jgi:hypothetical protein
VIGYPPFWLRCGLSHPLWLARGWPNHPQGKMRVVGHPMAKKGCGRNHPCLAWGWVWPLQTSGSGGGLDTLMALEGGQGSILKNKISFVFWRWPNHPYFWPWGWFGHPRLAIGGGSSYPWPKWGWSTTPNIFLLNYSICFCRLKN